MEKFLFVLRRLEPKQIIGLLILLVIIVGVIVLNVQSQIHEREQAERQAAYQAERQAAYQAEQATKSPTPIPDLDPVLSPTGLTANEETTVEYCEMFVSSALTLDPKILTFTDVLVGLLREDAVEHEGESYDKYWAYGYVNHIKFDCTLLIGDDGFIEQIDADSVTIEVGGFEY